jgi:hypothetical protein
MATAKLKELDYIKAWAFFWVLSTLGGALAGLVGGGLLGFILGGLGFHIRTIRFLCGGFGFLLGIPISYLIFQFSIRMFLVPKLSSEAAPNS